MPRVRGPASGVRRHLNRDALKELLIRYGVGAETDPALRFLDYLSLLEKWNARVNLTSTTDWESLGPLFEEAIWAAGFYPDAAAAHLDIGSGAGFPALLMHVLRPRMRLVLAEPRAKRAAFLETAVHELELADARVFQGRLEDLMESRAGSKRWDFVSWKALRPGRQALSKLLSRTGKETQFWVFHGARLPLDDVSLSMFRQLRRETFPGKSSWFLSILLTRQPGNCGFRIAHCGL